MIKVFFLLLLCFSFLNPVTAKDTMKDASFLKKTWVLRKQDVYSPWNVRIVPVFFDFDSTKITIRGYGVDSEEVHSYRIEDDIIDVDDGTKFRVKSISESVLVLDIDGSDYTYFSLEIAHGKAIDVDMISKLLVSNGQWRFRSTFVEFTADILDLGVREMFKMVQYRGGEKFFGTYFVDLYKGNIFLVLLIDGTYKEEMFRVVDFTSDRIRLAEIDHADLVDMTFQKKN